MSFILDALKKSESDRQRQNGPALFEVRVAPPRTRLPLWAIAIALLLLVNLGIVMWMLLRHQAHGGTADVSATTVAGAASAGAAAGTPTPAAGASIPAPNPPLAGTSAQLPTVAASAPAPSGAAPAPLTGAPLTGAPLAGTPSAGAASAAASAPPAASPAPPTAGATAEGTNPSDYAPAEEPSGPGLGSHVRRGTASGVPLYQELTTTPGAQLPQLRLDLHVFAGRAEERFVMINMHKLHEGDTLPEGVHVDAITPEGAVLSFKGTKFLLPRD
ncbi:MAG TPA: general secretion pathway protein GspB [Steroidobacteraceae bacterium]|jgi:general secretion pathway protein B